MTTETDQPQRRRDAEGTSVPAKVWKPGRYKIAQSSKTKNVWLKGILFENIFGISFRSYGPCNGWVITHLPTGTRVSFREFKKPLRLAEAKQIVEKIFPMASWRTITRAHWALRAQIFGIFDDVFKGRKS